jgi:5-methylcytosine-specific restriction endonuclease McrA
MEAALTRLVWQRAQGRCEYCQMPQAADDGTFEIDHIRSRKHHGPSVAGNLCLSCYYCNSFKGSDLTGFDRKTRKITPLFNPRRHTWATHFRWEGPRLVGRTAIGRVTVALLHINDEDRVELREVLIEQGEFPPGP